MIGAGAMAEALGAGWTKTGHEVLISGRTPDKAAKLAERIAQAAVGAQVVKAFNLCAAELWHLGPRDFEGRTLAVPLCGDDPQAVATVAALVRDLGLRPMNSGGLMRARYLEAVAVFVMGLWFAGHDARAAVPPLESAFAVPDGND